MSRVLVAYFTVSGRTSGIAKDLSRAIRADLYKIRPAEPYTRKDLSRLNRNSRVSLEKINRRLRPALSDQVAHIESYDIIFLGFPIWFGTAPAIIRSFLESYDFSGRKIVLFATSRLSGFGNTAADLRPSTSPNAVIVEGTVFRGQQSPDDLRVWAERFL